jgi:hypothetical protein
MSAAMEEQWDYEPVRNVVALPLAIRPAALPLPSEIPPREWLYGTRLIRRFVSLLVAPGGTGKSMFAIGVAISLASGRPLFGDKIHRRVNSWVLNLEDPMDELDRRVAAVMLRHNVQAEELDGRLFLHSGRDRRLVVAQQADYGEIIFPDKEAIINAARLANIGYIVVDPFVKSHGLEENSNPHMDAAVTAWSEIAQETGAAIELVHHTRKGATVDADAGRGASALRDGARVTQTLSTMTQEEAQALGISEADRRRYVRLDDQKSNMAPPAAVARWFVMEMVSLGNATPEYPNGDNVAALVSWAPTRPMSTFTTAELNRVLDLIAAGPEPGVLYTRSAKGGSGRWCGQPVMIELGIGEGQAKGIVEKWFETGLLFEDAYKHPTWRRLSRGVRVNDTLRPTEPQETA